MPEQLNELDAVVVENFVRYLRALHADQERLLVIGAVRDAYCFECGGEQSERPYGPCQCRNDE